jgi:hypothetical protein
MSRKSFEEFSAGLPIKRAGTTTESETPATQPRVPTDTVGDRLADVGNTAGITIRSAIRGEGEFEDASLANRSVNATAAGFATVPGGALAMAPEPVRKGVDWIGNKFQQGFGALTGSIAKTPLFRDAVGYEEVDPETGVSRFVESDMGVLTDALETTSGAGELAGMVAGAGIRPRVKTPRMSGDVPITSQPDVPRPVRITNGVEKNEQILSQFGDAPTPSPVGATIQGIGQQVGEFAGRTVREAQDVAKRNQELSALPKPEANLRRSVADDRVVDLFETLTPEETLVTQRLVDQAKLKQKDITTNTQHPKVIAGEELLKPVQYIIDTRRNVGSELGEMRKQLDTRKNINTNSAFRNFHQSLKNNYGVEFDTQGNIVPGVGTLARTDIPEIQKLYDEMRSKTFASQREIDQFLQRTLKDFDLKQAREQTFSDEVTRIAEQARSEMRQLMPAQYNALSTEYARLSKPLTDMIKLLGYKGDLDALTAKDLKAGEVGMRILGNAADRPQSVIDSVVNTAEGNGYSSNVNLNNIVAIADQLESLYDITPNRSLSGQVTGAVENSNAIGAMGDAATMNIGGLYNRAMQSRATQREVQDMLDAYIQSKLSTPSGATAARAVTPETEAQALNLSKRLNESSQSSVPEYLRNNPQGGFMSGGSIIPQRITPVSVAKKMDDKDFDAIAVIAEDVANARLNPAVNRLLDDMGIGKASDDDVKAFLVRTSDEYAKDNPQATSFNQGATPQTTLLEEAKKYKTADEFVKKPRGDEDTLYHYTNAEVGGTLKPMPDVELAEMNYLGDGVYVTNQKNGYEGSNELLAFPAKDLKVLDLTSDAAEENFLQQISKEIGAPVARSGGGLYDDLRLMASNIGENHQKVKDAVSKASKGYDGIKANFAKYTDDDNYYELVINKDVDVKTREQLEDIWKQANE